jgi:hypothetical protein
MAFYRLRQALEAQELSAFPSRSRQFARGRIINTGEIIETVSSPSNEGRALIRYEGSCYRVWKEDLLTVAERVQELRGEAGRGVHA